jgi:hypothetical protein
MTNKGKHIPEDKEKKEREREEKVVGDSERH